MIMRKRRSDALCAKLFRLSANKTPMELRDISLHEQTFWGDLSVNEKRTLRQKQILTKWIDQGCYGYVTAVTGFGKSWLGKIAIRRCLASDSNRVVHIIVPTNVVADVWKDIIEAENWHSVRVFTIIAYLNQNEPCDMLVIDEVHRILNKDSKRFSTVLETAPTSWKLCLSATLKAEHKQFLEAYSLKRVDEVTLEEAEREGYISPYDFFALKVPLTREETSDYKDVSDEFDKAYAHFGRNYKYLQTLLKDPFARKEFEHRKGIAPGVCAHLVRKTYELMRERESMLKQHPRKIDYAVRIISEHFSDKPVLVFTESTEVVNQLVERLGDKAAAYHGGLPTQYFRDGKLTSYDLQGARFARARGIKINAVSGDRQCKQNLSAFESGRVGVLACARMLDEGANIDGATVAIILSYSSASIQMVQRLGRVIRYAEGKHATIVALYMGTAKFKTQEKRWLEKAISDPETPMKRPVYIETLIDLRTHLHKLCTLTQRKS